MKFIGDTSGPPGLYRHPDPDVRYPAGPDAEPDDLAGVRVLLEQGEEEWVQRFVRPCAYCGRGFIPKRSMYARYCSDSHRAMASQKRLGRR